MNTEEHIYISSIDVCITNYIDPLYSWSIFDTDYLLHTSSYIHHIIY